MSRDYRSLKKKKEGLVRKPFDMDEAKVYLIIIMILFHIVPLIFKLVPLVFKQSAGTGDQMLAMVGVMINPMAIFAVLLVYGIRVGLNFKMPAICSAIELLSLFMYYVNVSNVINFMTSIQHTVALGIVYVLFTFLAIFIGSFVKRYMV